MRTFRNYAIAALVVIGVAASVPLLAQQSSDLLTKKEVHELAMTAKTPAEHAKLQKHFLALAAKYDADAADHAELAQDYLKPQTGGRLMPGSPKMRAQHCDRLSASLKEAAKDARELASEHGKMATAK
ncbi:MAG: hypothetical protein ABMA15_14485 [Vicinamibacterales bacterium]